jgi:hypothetical protein
MTDSGAVADSLQKGPTLIEGGPTTRPGEWVVGAGIAVEGLAAYVPALNSTAKKIPHPASGYTG